MDKKKDDIILIICLAFFVVITTVFCIVISKNRTKKNEKDSHLDFFNNRETNYNKETINTMSQENLFENEIDDVIANTLVQEENDEKYNNEESPELEVVNSDTKLVIVATDDDGIDYLKYSWDDENEEKISLKSGKELEISIPEGEHLLKIEVSDKKGNIKTFSNAYINDGTINKEDENSNNQ